MEVRTIKGISKEKWILLKSIAAKNNESMGRTFEIIIEDYAKKEDSAWDRILRGKKILSDKEAEEMREITTKLRKERGFRDVISH